jgi:hypothetical protein
VRLVTEGFEGRVPDEVVKGAVQRHREVESGRTSLQSLGIYINYVRPVVHQGKKSFGLEWRSVDSRTTTP